MNPEAYEDMAQAQSLHWWFVGRRHILRSELERLSLPSSVRILEIGSGTGANLGLLREFGEVTGLEMNGDALAHSRRTLSGAVDVRQGRWPCAARDLGRRFDLVCLFDVLEHINEESAAVAALGTILKPGGHVVLTVPAYPWLWGPHDLVLQHERRYTRNRLARVLQDGGLQLQRVSYFNTLLFPLACASRLMDRWSRKHKRPGQIPPPNVNRLLAGIFASERHLLGRTSLPFGLSLLAVARAPT